jgi:glycopeptide antibiotics resistance protein
MMKTVAPANAKGSGGHNQNVSVINCIPFSRSQVYVETSRLNRERQKRIAERDGILFEEE